MKFDIITIFPSLFDSFRKEALIARAQKKRIATIKVHNLRQWTTDNHQTVDDRPYGGGAGMVMRADVILKAVNALRRFKIQKSKIKITKQNSKIILLSASGKRFTQSTARRYAKYKNIILICGRYEGIDERVARYIADEEISIGDYVLFGGEIPAMVVMEAVTRLLPGAVGKEESVARESFTDAALIEHPHYTRPEMLKINNKIRRVPKVLLSGNHKKIEGWRKEHSMKKTKRNRPDLL